MQRCFNPFFVLLVVILTVSACKDDKEDEVQMKNKLKYNGADYAVTNASFYNDGELHDENGATGTYRMEVYLTSGIVNDGDGWTGQGNMLYLTLHTSDPAGVVAGTYTVVGEDAAIFPLQASVVAFAPDFKLGDSLLDEADVATSGSIVVKKSGDVFTYDVNVKIGEKSLVANYTGTVLEIDN